MSEHNDLRNRILIWLSGKGFLAWSNVVLVGRALTSDAIIHAGGKGRPDIMAVAPKDAKFWGVEVKVGKDKLRPEQKVFRDQLIKRGGIFIEARSLQDVQSRYEVEIQE